MGHISLALSELMVLTGFAASASAPEPTSQFAAPPQALRSSGETELPYGGRSQARRPAAVSTAERNAVQQYRRCVLNAAKRAMAKRVQPSDVPLRALYSCPKMRADTQNLLTRTYGLTHKQTLFNALDQRLLEEVRWMTRAAR